jgi:glycosyltransferase involved in cell wall biosynthesis
VTAVAATDEPTRPPRPRPAARVLLAQWAGDYREAYRRLAAGGDPTYYAQRYSVEAAGDLARAFDAYGVLCLTGGEPHDETLPNGVRSIALGAGDDPAAAVDRFRPTHLVLTTPQTGLMDRAFARGVRLLPLFFDTFARPAGGWSPRRLARAARHAWFRRRLVRRLNDPRVRWVGNHNVPACRNLVAMGVDPAKVVPFDFPPAVRPDDHGPKDLARRPGGWELAFVGAVDEAKGVGDAVRAVGELRRRGRAVRLRVVGRGDLDRFRRLAAEVGAAAAVEFLGPRPHREAVAAVRDADLALVPSRHEYPEGLPYTIYEALAVRTPVVCSDHPAFRDRVGRAAVCVPERSPAALADAVERLLTDPAGYRRASEATAAAWAGLQCPVEYYEFVRRWAAGDPADDRWLAAHALASGRYA